jgi:hypothetical protein
MVARRGDAPAKTNDGGTARGCAGQKSDHQIGGLAANTPAYEETKAAGNAPAKSNNAKSVAARRGMRRQTKQHQIGGSAANAPANKATPNRWIGGECAGKQSNTKSVDWRRMRRQKKQHQIGGSAANAPANKATPNQGIGGECAGKRSNTKSVDRRQMRRQTERLRHDDGMRRPDKQNAARR